MSKKINNKLSMNFNAVVVGMVMSLSIPAISTAANTKKTRAFAKGRILVEAKAGLSDDELAKILTKHKGKGRKIGKSKLHVVDLPADVSEVDAVNELSLDPNVKFAELDMQIEATATANDPLLGSEWHIGKVGAFSAWDITRGAGVTIAILDSGVDPTHPDLVPNLVAGYNTYDNNTNTTDVCGHGTAVAGTSAAAINNATGVAGVAGQAKIMPIRIAYYDTSVGGCYAYTSTIAAGINWAADHGARIANVSYGPLAGSPTIQSAANYMKSKGGLVFVSAGNNGIDENIVPTTSLIAVSATDSSDLKASWSSYGNFVSITAPGTGIYTTSNGGSYGGWNGTSFSSPLAAGVAALVMAAKPSLTSAEVEKILFSTSVDIGAVGRDNLYGYGRVDAAAAVLAAVSAPGNTDTQAPIASITQPTGNSTVSGLVSISVSASDNVGVSKVDLKVNGVVIGTDTSAPYSFSWDSKTVADGTVTLSAVVYDAAGNVGSSSNVSVKVVNTVTPPPPPPPPPVSDVTAPVVAITNPVAGAKVSGNVAIRVKASDNNGAAGISLVLSVDGVIKAKVTGGSLNWTWNTRKISSGAHTISVKASDAAGNTSTSSVQVSK